MDDRQNVGSASIAFSVAIAGIIALLMAFTCKSLATEPSRDSKKVSRFLVESSPSDGSIVSISLCTSLVELNLPSVEVSYLERGLRLLQVSVRTTTSEDALWAIHPIVLSESNLLDGKDVAFNVAFINSDGSYRNSEEYFVTELIDEFRAEQSVTQGATCEAAKLAESGRAYVRRLNIKL
jgi:hypothetical protein